ncbi:hypothetical protein LIX87_02590 [Weissella viridescens]|uniref:hypothetical protein n=1 Tax=Weissella viridescens TaxID=1629 RepID=UPI001D0782F4|nr:hypothetical protein [Weissella viridescens]MCB6839909.1 hypothetical protein [Weissella viridescens]MCB6846641.1 hypothetical protein [Weissella viridescens]
MTTFNEHRAHDIAMNTLHFLMNNPEFNGISEDNQININIMNIYQTSYKEALDTLNRDTPDN